MVKFSDKDLKEKLLASLMYFTDANNEWLYIEIEGVVDYNGIDYIIEFLDKIKIINEEYCSEELEEYGWAEDDDQIELSEMTNIKVSLDSIETELDYTLNEFIKLVYEANNVIINDGIYYSDKMVVLRCDIINDVIDYYEEFPMYCSDFTYNGSPVNMSISQYNDIYILRTFLDGNFNEFYPLKTEQEIFIEIKYDSENRLTSKEVDILYNTFIYKIFVLKGYKLELSPRIPIEIFEEEKEFEGDSKSTRIEINEMIFSKGMNEIILLFNKAEGYNLDRAIVEYVKVIEYVSVTVVRKNIIIEIQNKLNTLDGVKDNADNVINLVETFENIKKKNKNDAAMIKSAIIECCDILIISKYSPQFIESLYNLKAKMGGNKSNENNLKKQAFKDLAQSISDTRNNLSHAKANYNRKGLECPDNQKEQFIILLRNICIQVIRWFCSSDETIRITNEMNNDFVE